MATEEGDNKDKLAEEFAVFREDIVHSTDHDPSEGLLGMVEAVGGHSDSEEDEEDLQPLQPVAIDREVVYFDMTDWRGFGRAPDFFERKINDVITQRRDLRGCGRVRIWVCPASATRQDHMHGKS